MDAIESIVDMLEKSRGDDDSDKINDEEIMVPRRCAFCINSVICSVLPTLIGISRIGIIVGIEECRYHKPNNIQKPPTQE